MGALDVETQQRLADLRLAIRNRRGPEPSGMLRALDYYVANDTAVKLDERTVAKRAGVARASVARIKKELREWNLWTALCLRLAPDSGDGESVGETIVRLRRKLAKAERELTKWRERLGAPMLKRKPRRTIARELIAALAVTDNPLATIERALERSEVPRSTRWGNDMQLLVASLADPDMVARLWTQLRNTGHSDLETWAGPVEVHPRLVWAMREAQDYAGDENEIATRHDRRWVEARRRAGERAERNGTSVADEMRDYINELMSDLMDRP